MTATANPTDFGSRTSETLLRLVAVAAVLVMLAVGAFALGRITADDNASPAATTHAVTHVQTVTPPAQDPCVRFASADCGDNASPAAPVTHVQTVTPPAQDPCVRFDSTDC